MRAAGGLLRRHRQEQPRPRHQDDQDAGRRVRRGVELGRRHRGDRMTIEITKEISHAPPPPVPERALAVEVLAMTKRFGEFIALDDVSLKVPPAASTRCSARTAPARAHWSSASW